MYRILFLFFAFLPNCVFADIASTTYVTEQTEQQVKVVGDQDIDGVKSFSTSPNVPTPDLPPDTEA